MHETFGFFELKTSPLAISQKIFFPLPPVTEEHIVKYKSPAPAPGRGLVSCYRQCGRECISKDFNFFCLKSVSTFGHPAALCRFYKCQV